MALESFGQGAAVTVCMAVADYAQGRWAPEKKDDDGSVKRTDAVGVILLNTITITPGSLLVAFLPMVVYRVLWARYRPR